MSLNAMMPYGSGFAVWTVFVVAADSRHHTPDPASPDQVVVRVLLLTASAVLAGIAVLAPFSAGALVPRRIMAGVSAGVTVVVGVPGLMRTDIQIPALVGHLALVVAIPLLLARPRLVCAAGLALSGLICAEATYGNTGAARWLAVAHVAASILLLGTLASAVVAEERVRSARRLAPIGLAAVAVVAVTGLVRAGKDGLGLDDRLIRTAFGNLLLVKAVLLVGLGALLVVVLRRSLNPGLYRAAVIGATCALAAGSTLAAVPRPVAEGGMPLLARVDLAGAVVPVLVNPHRPGPNLVHVGGEGSKPIEVGTDRGDLRPVRTLVGASGRWARVDLPPGRSTLWIRQGDETRAVTVNPGPPPATRPASATGPDGAAGPAGVTGPDGPECASAALGGLLAGGSEPLTSCPASKLANADAEALSGLVGFLRERKVTSITLAADGSPRGSLAAGLVRAEAAEAGIAVLTGKRAGDALVVVSGWSSAAGTLAEVTRRQDRVAVYPYGVYLAPWLLTAPVVSATGNALLPLRFAPHDRLPQTYAALLDAEFDGAAPSTAGFRAWLAGRTTETGQADELPRLYTASPVAFLPKEFEHHGDSSGWLPGGTIVPASGQLTPVTP